MKTLWPESTDRGLREIQDEAISRAEQGAKDDWLNAAYKLLHEVALNHEEFTSDELWELGLPSTRDNRALGAVFRAAARAGIIRRTNREQTSRLYRRNHGRTIRVWQSLKYKHQA